LYQFILLGAVPFRRDVSRLQKLGVHGVITLNEPFETLVPSSMYQASGLQVLYLFILKVICNFTYPIVLRSFNNLSICHLGTELLQPKLINQKYVDINAALLPETYSHVGLITLLFLQEIICSLLHLWILIKLLISFIVSVTQIMPKMILLNLIVVYELTTQIY